MRYVLTFFMALTTMSAISQTYSKDLEKKAKSGDSPAQIDLGICYLKGNGTEQDDKKAYKWFRKAANNNNADGQYFIAYMIENGKVEDSMPYEAWKWYSKAALNGQVEAIQKYIDINKSKGDKLEADEWRAKLNAVSPDKLYEAGIRRYDEKDFFNAINYFTMAADKGHVEAQYRAGMCYYDGVYLFADMKSAKKYLQMATSKGHSAARKTLQLILDKEREDSIALARKVAIEQARNDSIARARQAELAAQMRADSIAQAKQAEQRRADSIAIAQGRMMPSYDYLVSNCIVCKLDNKRPNNYYSYDYVGLDSFIKLIRKGESVLKIAVLMRIYDEGFSNLQPLAELTSSGFRFLNLYLSLREVPKALANKYMSIYEVLLPMKNIGHTQIDGKSIYSIQCPKQKAEEIINNKNDVYLLLIVTPGPSIKSSEVKGYETFNFANIHEMYIVQPNQNKTILNLKSNIRKIGPNEKSQVINVLNQEYQKEQQRKAKSKPLKPLNYKKCDGCNGTGKEIGGWTCTLCGGRGKRPVYF